MSTCSALSGYVHGKVMFGFWSFLSCFVCVHSFGSSFHIEGNKRSEDPGDPGDEEEAVEPTVQIADQ